MKKLLVYLVVLDIFMFALGFCLVKVLGLGVLLSLAIVTLVSMLLVPVSSKLVCKILED